MTTYISNQASNQFVKIMIVHKPAYQSSRFFQTVLRLSEISYAVREVTELAIISTTDFVRVGYLPGASHEVKLVAETSGDVSVWVKTNGDSNTIVAELTNCPSEGAFEFTMDNTPVSTVTGGYDPIGYLDDKDFIQIDDSHQLYYMRKNGYVTVMFTGLNVQLPGGGTEAIAGTLPEGYRPRRNTSFHLYDEAVACTITTTGSIKVVKSSAGLSNYYYGIVTYPI